MANDVEVQIELEEHVIEALNKIAEEENKTFNEVVNDILRKQMNAWDAMTPEQQEEYIKEMRYWHKQIEGDC